MIPSTMKIITCSKNRLTSSNNYESPIWWSNGPITPHHSELGIFLSVYSHGQFYAHGLFCCMANLCVLGCVLWIFYACFCRLTYPQGYPQGKTGVNDWNRREIQKLSTGRSLPYNIIYIILILNRLYKAYIYYIIYIALYVYIDYIKALLPLTILGIRG